MVPNQRAFPDEEKILKSQHPAGFQGQVLLFEFLPYSPRSIPKLNSRSHRDPMFIRVECRGRGHTEGFLMRNPVIDSEPAVAEEILLF